jgi:uroporphyrinogen III methyltransferase/synthase
LARWPGTLVFFMGGSTLSRICENLVSHGLAPQTPAALIRRGTTPRQRTVLDTVQGLADAADALPAHETRAKERS